MGARPRLTAACHSQPSRRRFADAIGAGELAAILRDAPPTVLSTLATALGATIGTAPPQQIERYLRRCAGHPRFNPPAPLADRITGDSPQQS